jgi:arabinofuranosyltransferase
MAEEAKLSEAARVEESKAGGQGGSEEGFGARLGALWSVLLLWWAPFGKWLIRYGVAFAPLLALLGLGAQQYGWLCDDAFISFRYAKHFAEGHGLVFNLGERVEGYSNFLWVLELGALKALFGAHIPTTSVVLSVLATLAYVALTALLAKSTPHASRVSTVIWVALALLVTNRNVLVWTTSGLETRQFSALVLLAVWAALAGRSSPRMYALSSLALGLAGLTRPEGPMLFAGVVAWYFLDSRLRQRFSFKELLFLALPFVLLCGAHYLFRYSYYGQWLPNTYYAKVVRPWPDAGLSYLTAAFCDSGLYILAPLAVLGAVLRLGRRDTLHVLSAVLVVPHAVYIMLVGGDHFEFRLLDFWWPLLAVAAADGLVLLAHLFGKAGARWGADARKGAYALALTALLGVAVAYGTVLQFGHDASTYEHTERGHTVNLSSSLSFERLPFLYLLPGMRETIVPAYNAALQFCVNHAIAIRWREHRVFWKAQQGRFARYEGRIAGALPKSAVLATGVVGVGPYYLSPLEVIDERGLTDPVVARHGEPLNGKRAMAHDRWPPPGYLEKRGVNIDIYWASSSLQEALAISKYALDLGDGLWMPFDSKKPAWVEEAFAGKKISSASLRGSTAESLTATLNGRKLRGFQLLGSFEDGSLDGWQPEGPNTADPQPTAGKVGRQGNIAGIVGGGLINSFGSRRGDGAVMAVRSPRFKAEVGTVLAFLVGGGATPEVGVEVLEGERVVASFRGFDSEQLGPVLFDLTPFAGKELDLRVADRSTGPWGHILADQFVLMR